MSAFSEASTRLFGAGYSIIPLAPGTKSPTLEKWTRYCKELPTHDDIVRWNQWQGANIGVCLGVASGIIAIDLDNDVDGLIGKIEGLLPATPVAKTGKKGKTLFYRYTGELSRGLSVSGVRVVDILSSGRQTVLPPSIHPDTGKPYEWFGRPLWEYKSSDLPAILNPTMQTIVGLFRPDPKPVIQTSQRFYFEETGQNDVAEALGFIPADDYDTWYQIGMTLKDKFGEAGFGLWDKWSQTCPQKYPLGGHVELRQKWDSFKGTGLTIATLFYKALDRGYRPVTSAPDLGNVVDIIEGGNIWQMMHGKKIYHEHKESVRTHTPDHKKSDNFPLHLLDAPGLVGKICRYINRTAIYPQPILTLSNAISAVGVLMAHRVQTETHLRTNMLTIGLAPSGAGKGHSMKCIEKLFDYATASDLTAGEPASGAGLLTALVDAKGRLLIQWDEFGRVLSVLNSRTAMSHQREILTQIVRIFSAADTNYKGTQYANHDRKMSRKDINQPCLCIYGATVPSRFFGGITGEDAIDGFLSRWLVFESKDYTIDPVQAEDADPPPQELIDEVKRWQNMPTNAEPQGNLDAAVAIRPLTVSYDDKAREMIQEFRRAMRTKIAQEPDSQFNPVFARAAEHADKLALIAHDGQLIDERAMAWGIEVATWCARYLCIAVKDFVAENETEEESKKILNIIRQHKGWMTHSKLVQKSQWLKTPRRNEILTNLDETGAIEVRKITEDNKRPRQEYYAKKEDD